MSIVTIIIILIVIGVLVSVLEWIRDNIIPILSVIAIVLGLIFFRKPTIILLSVAAVCAILFFFFVHVIRPVLTDFQVGLAQRKEEKSAIKVKKLEEKRLKAELEEKKREDARKLEALPDAPKEFIKVSQECIANLDSEKMGITNAKMTAKITDCQESIREICAEVERMQEVNSSLDRLIVYYYPTMCKLVKTYSVYEKRNNDENNVKTEIVTTMGEINAALKAINTRIINNDDLDVLSDISVVKQMIERDGLKEGIVK